MITTRKTHAALLLLVMTLGGCQSKEERTAGFVESGNQYFAAEDFDAARIQFANALQLDEHNVAALEAMSKIYEKEQKLPELYKALSRILELDPTHVETRLRLVSILLYVNELDKALAESDLLLEQAPGRADVHVVRAGLLFRMGRGDDAASEANRVLQLDASNKQARSMLANNLLIDKRYDDALAMLEPALQAAPQDVMLNSLKIGALNAAGRASEATAVYQMLIQNYPTDISLHNALASHYLANGDAVSAEALLRAFAEREKRPEASLSVVEYLVKNKSVTAAAEQLVDYIQRFPDQSELQFVLTEIYLASDRGQDAKKLLNNLVAGASKTADKLRAKNELAGIAGREKDAVAEAELYRQVLVEDPQNVTAVVGLARLDLARKDAEKAIRDLRSALAFAANAPDVHLALAQAHEMQELTALAQDYYASALRYGGHNELYVSEYARFLMNKGDMAFAEELLERASKRAPGGPRLLSLLAQVKLNTGKWNEAQHYADELERQDADQALVNRIRGVAYSGKAEYDKSLTYFEKAQQIAPGDIRPMATLVGAYLRAGKRNEAEEFLKVTLRTDPGNVFAQLLRGAVHEHFQESAAAEQAYRRAIEMDPTLQEPYRRLSQALIAQNKLPEALTVVRAARAEAQDNPDLAVSEALLLQQMGLGEEAVTAYRQMIVSNPEADIAYNNLASLLIDGNETERQEARKIAERFRSSQIPHFQDTLGWIYLKTGNQIEGLYLLEKAALGLKGHPEVHYHLGMAYLQNDRALEAKRELEQALAQGGEKFAQADQVKAALAGLAKRVSL